MTVQIPRGIRNNNPGNVDYHPSKDPWLGLATPPDDGRFCRFVDARYGIRVMRKLLQSYQLYQGLRTVRAIIDRWAPPTENNTSAYVTSVAKAMEVNPDVRIDIVGDVRALQKMVRAMIVHENGSCPYSDAQIAEGCARDVF